VGLNPLVREKMLTAYESAYLIWSLALDRAVGGFPSNQKRDLIKYLLRKLGYGPRVQSFINPFVELDYGSIHRGGFLNLFLKELGYGPKQVLLTRWLGQK
jgi:hypothetical protein